MKRIISIFLIAIILIISVFSVNAFASEQTKAEKWAENWTEDIKNQKVECEMSWDTISYGEKYNSHVYIKGENLSFITDLPITETFSIKVNIIINDGYCYMYLTSFPFFHIKVQQDFWSYDEIFPFEEVVLVDAKEVTENQTTYYVEEYAADNGMLIKWYFIGDKLIKIQFEYTDEYGDYTYNCFEIISDEVDDSVFQVPWYSIDISSYLALFGEPDFSTFI